MLFGFCLSRETVLDVPDNSCMEDQSEKSQFLAKDDVTMVDRKRYNSSSRLKESRRVACLFAGLCLYRKTTLDDSIKTSHKLNSVQPRTLHTDNTTKAERTRHNSPPTLQLGKSVACLSVYTNIFSLFPSCDLYRKVIDT